MGRREELRGCRAATQEDSIKGVFLYVAAWLTTQQCVCIPTVKPHAARSLKLVHGCWVTRREWHDVQGSLQSMKPLIRFNHVCLFLKLSKRAAAIWFYWNETLDNVLGVTLKGREIQPLRTLCTDKVGQRWTYVEKRLWFFTWNFHGCIMNETTLKREEHVNQCWTLTVPDYCAYYTKLISDSCVVYVICAPYTEHKSYTSKVTCEKSVWQKWNGCGKPQRSICRNQARLRKSYVIIAHKLRKIWVSWVILSSKPNSRKDLDEHLRASTNE